MSDDKEWPRSPDEEPTPTEVEVHEPIARTVRGMRRQIWVALAANALVLIGLSWLVYYQSVTLGAWRQHGRDLQVEILNRVRAHDGMFRDVQEAALTCKATPTGAGSSP